MTSEKRTMSQVPLVVAMFAIIFGGAYVVAAVSDDRPLSRAESCVASDVWGPDAGPIGISHEGVKGDVGIATISSFERAYELGYRHMETDVRLFDDVGLIALHETVGDVEPGDITAVLQASIRENDEDLPTVPVLLSRFPDVSWNFELKGDDGAAAAVLADEVPREEWNRILISFGTALSTQKTDSIRDALPAGTCFAASLRERALDWSFPLFRPLAPSESRIHVTQAQHEPLPGASLLFLDESDVSQARARGLAIHAYDILGQGIERDDVEYLLDIGVDGIMVSDPSGAGTPPEAPAAIHRLVRAALQDRGAWPPPSPR